MAPCGTWRVFKGYSSVVGFCRLPSAEPLQRKGDAMILHRDQPAIGDGNMRTPIELAPAAATPDLLALLNDDDDRVKGSAVRIIAALKLRNSLAASRAQRVIDNDSIDDRTRAPAIRVPGATGAASVAEIRKFLDSDENDDIKGAAVVALSDLGQIARADVFKVRPVRDSDLYRIVADKATHGKAPFTEWLFDSSFRENFEQKPPKTPLPLEAIGGLLDAAYGDALGSGAESTR
jgi:hypothetical protein